jgi:hypothetical protein
VHIPAPIRWFMAKFAQLPGELRTMRKHTRTRLAVVLDSLVKRARVSRVVAET